MLSQLNQTAFFNLTRDLEIERDCLKSFSQKTCETVYFDESPKATYAANEHNLSLNLNFDTVLEKEIEASSLRTALDILNLLSILLGTNALGLFALLLLLLEKLFKAKIKRNKISQFLLISFCLLGFSAHNYLIFREIIRSDLFESAYFEKINEFDLQTSLQTSLKIC